MPTSCCVVGCTNRHRKDRKLVFYRLPAGRTPFEARRRRDWIKAINKKVWETWSNEKISRERVCGEHFISGKRSDDPQNIDWAPSVFKHTRATEISTLVKKEQTRKRFEKLTKKQAPAVSTPIMHVHEIPDEVEKINNIKYIDIGFKADAAVQCDLLSEQLELLKNDLQQYKRELNDRNKELYQLKEENKKLKMNRLSSTVRAIASNHYF